MKRKRHSDEQITFTLRQAEAATGGGDLSQGDGGGNLFFQLVNTRHEKGAMILTSNRFGEWGEVFGDPVVATALLDLSRDSLESPRHQRGTKPAGKLHPRADMDGRRLPGWKLGSQLGCSEGPAYAGMH